MFTDLFYIKNISFAEGRLNASVSLNDDHAIFNGHFPGQPVLPGVCQMALVKGLLEQHFGRKLSMPKADQVKFMAMIDPRRTPNFDIQIQIGEMDGTITAQSIITAGEITFLKSKARFVNA